MSVAEFKMAKMDKEQYPVNPKKFMMWVFLVSVTMLFAAFTSGMIVRRGDGNWTYFIVPGIFTVTTIIAVLSSITMQWAYYAAKKNNLFNLRYFAAVNPNQAMPGAPFTILPALQIKF